LARGGIPDLLYGNGYASPFNRILDIMEEKSVDFPFDFVTCVFELSNTVSQLLLLKSPWSPLCPLWVWVKF
jgi:hypothetical protein